MAVGTGTGELKGGGLKSSRFGPPLETQRKKQHKAKDLERRQAARGLFLPSTCINPTD
jgi:hypothetical protein